MGFQADVADGGGCASPGRPDAELFGCPKRHEWQRAPVRRWRRARYPRSDAWASGAAAVQQRRRGGVGQARAYPG
jgi:hypothetical protein